MEVSSSSLCDLSEDVVVEEILSRLPIEQLIKCRYVSKLWKNGLIPRVLLSQQKPKPTFGLIAKHSSMEKLTDGSPVKLSLLRRIEEDEQRSGGGGGGGGGGGEYIQAIPNLFSLCLNESEMLSSCNGLLLLWIREAEPKVKPMTIYHYFYICNPVLNQWVALPQPNYSLRSWSPNIGFASYDTTIDDHQGHHYKVVHFYLDKTYLLETKMIPCEIFSSETGEWRHHQARLLSTSSIFSDIAFRILETDDRFWTNKTPHLYHKGVIYWKFDWYNYLLLFLLEDDVFKLIPLPDDPTDGFVCHGRFGSSLLSESNGCIYYLWDTLWKLHVWEYLGSSTKEDEEWVLKHVVERQILIPQMPPESCLLSISMARFHIFDADLQVLYLRMNGETFSYNLETKKLTALRTYKYENNAGGDKGDLVPLTGLGNIIPYQFTLFDLPTWDGCKVLRPKLSADKTCLLTRSLFNLQT